MKELEALRQKITQTMDSLSHFLALHSETSWNDVLSHFTVLISKYSALQLELQSVPLLEQLILHPTSLPTADPDFIPRVLLRSKPIPELENNIKLDINILDETAVKTEMRKHESKRELHDDLVRTIEKSIERINQDYQMYARISEESDEDEVMEDVTPNKVPQVTQGDPKKELEYWLKFMSSGPEFVSSFQSTITS